MLSSRFFRVTRKRPCKICRHSTWCTYTETTAFCMRVYAGSFGTAKNGAHLHSVVVPVNTARVSDLVLHHDSPRASDEHLDLVYSSFLGFLSLSEAHAKSLLDRGLSKSAIQSDCYRSAPTRELTIEVVKNIKHLGLQGVPGFFKRDGEWVMTTVPVGILIPVRTSTNKIYGIQIRLDDPARGSRYIWFSSSRHPSGTSSGAPVHWSKPGRIATHNESLLTEGALKANVISHFLGIPVIAAAGVRSFGTNFANSIKAAYANITVIICFDSDWRSKEEIRNALKALRRQLTDSGVQWRVRCWPSEYKGYDDYLLTHFGSEVAA